jgi:ferrochelatase
MSFHGVPERTLHLGDPYHCECLKTARLLAERLGLRKDRYQRHLPVALWQGQVAGALHRAHLEGAGKAACTVRVDVVCPGFTSDCLETLEEINMEVREAFLHAAAARSFTLHPLPERQRDGHWITALTAPRRHSTGISSAS